MSTKNTKEDNVTIQPPDLDCMKTILEGAEIEYEEDNGEGGLLILNLDNGVTLRFGSDRELVSMEVE